MLWDLLWSEHEFGFPWVEPYPELRRNDISWYDSAWKRDDEIYRHYKRYWSTPQSGKKRIPKVQIELGRKRIEHQLLFVRKQFKRRHLCFKGVHLVEIAGNNSANGHAFPGEDGTIVWLAVECFTTFLETKIFVTHALVHGIHYRDQPGFAVHTTEEKHLVWRQLITEGVATYLTKKILKVPDEIALWADVLPPGELASWMDACRARERELFEYIDRNFDSSDPASALFYAADPHDIFTYRAGYYAGLKLIEKVCKEQKIRDSELPTLPVDMMQEYVRDALRNWNFVDNS